MLKHGILGLLNYGEMTGYEIKEVFACSLKFFWTAQTSQIYRELQTIEKNHWAKSTLIMQEGKPDKKVFKITDEGKKELLHWLIFEDSGLTMRSPLLMKVFFMGELSTKESIAFFENFQIEMEKYLNGLQMADEYIDIFARQMGEAEKALYWELTLDFGRRNMQMYIDWAKTCINKLKDFEKGQNAINI